MIDKIKYKLLNRRLKKINDNVIKSTMFYFAHKSLKDSEISACTHFICSRLKDIDMLKYTSNFNLYIADSAIGIVYQFKISELKCKNIHFEIEKTIAET